MVGCPSCGVAVVAGYVKCPRCHAVLPRTTTARRAAVDEGGTTVQARAFPVAPVALGAIAVAVVLVLVLGGGGNRRSATTPAATTPAVTTSAVTTPAVTTPAATTPAATVEALGPAASAPAPGAPAPAADAELAIPTTSAPAPARPAPAPQAAPRPLEIPAATGPSPAVAVAELERALGRQRLWSSVETAGARVDVRSGSCGDPTMAPMIDAARATLRSVGLTRLRCLAQSGAVVFERDL